ncbi:unnamed protein product [Cladocopium goreaui]|uniref:Uncharacterized protein n=1 Tax=Cladocopium goreaui TaxID=2562237 RepID=A0A9P1DUT8_9DINO|nr:unnamed protein product [Cladocopium goreaui]
MLFSPASFYHAKYFNVLWLKLHGSSSILWCQQRWDKALSLWDLRSGTKALLEQVSASSSAAGTVQTLQSPLPPQDFTAFKNFDLEDRPVPVEGLASRRVTEMELADRTKQTFTDNWRRPLSVEDTFVAKLDKAKDKELWRTLRLLSYKQHDEVSPDDRTFILARVLILLQPWNANMNMNRKKLDLVPRCSDFRVYSLLWLTVLIRLLRALQASQVCEDIYVIPPAEYYPDQNVVWKLKRAPYGLKNSPKELLLKITGVDTLKKVTDSEQVFTEELLAELYAIGGGVADSLFVRSLVTVELDHQLEQWWRKGETFSTLPSALLHADAYAQYQSDFGTGTVFIYRLLRASCAAFEGMREFAIKIDECRFCQNVLRLERIAAGRWP